MVSVKLERLMEPKSGEKKLFDKKKGGTIT